MKINMPVTNNEIQFSDNTFMLTKTDIKGVITYTNADFIRVSGFSEAELVGSSHNLVRHPDMPIEAFADMWTFLKAGKPWTGMVKNRTKNGDYYWVEANAAPIYENGQITGYLSARKKPTRTQVEVTDAAYRLFKDGKAKGLRIEEGKVVRDSIGRSLKAVLQNLNINQRISAIIALSVAMVVMAAFSHYVKTDAIPNAILGLAIVLLVGMGVAVMRSITKPLKQTLAVFDAIASSHLDTYIDVEGNSEMSSVLRALKTTQTMLTVNESAQRDLSKKIEEESVKYEAQLAAIAKSSGVVEFDMDGKIIAANDIFLKVMGYVQGEVIGQHHSTLVLSDYSKSADYIKFWQRLNAGEAIVGEFRYMAKGGKDVWLQASYNPIVDATGKPYKVVEYAADVTEAKLKNADFEGKIEAIGKSQGEIEVGLDGSILKINALYLSMLGYSTSELLGKQFSTLFDSNFAKSAAYSDLWNQLVQGGAVVGQCKRIAKNGKEVWIQTSYNPIMDLNDKPFKIVNYAVDISAQKIQAADYEGQIAAINKIQGVIEFDLAGKITAVNENFANVTGYSEKEIIGNHHSMFVEPVYKSSHEYKAFWDKLNRGEADSGQYKRIGKGGNEIWLQASYNPILDMNGKPFKVMKYATDITEQHAAAATLTEAVEETQEVIESAKAGDLSIRVPLEGKTGAIASLCDGVNALMDKMTEVIIQVKEAGETINTAASEISSGNTDLSSRTEQQASSLEETAASMEELASTVKQNAENAKQANQLASAASGVAVKGGEVVGQVVKTMSDINTSAKKIEDIISVIDGIAFQTNILALNAAVEAARAGEQGRGFAVVAGEVRNLAQRSASAAKEIKELISASVSKTAQGTSQVEEAGKTMQEIVSSVQRVTDIMSEIAAASVQQSAGIDQVNQAVTNMDEVTQQNAALVEQAAAAAESLVDQAAGLMNTVSAFRLSGGAGHRSKASVKILTKKHPGPTASARFPAMLIKKSSVNEGDWEEF